MMVICNDKSMFLEPAVSCLLSDCAASEFCCFCIYCGFCSNCLVILKFSSPNNLSGHI